MIRKLIKTDGTEQDLIGPTSIQDIQTLIGADCLDTVIMRHMGPPLHVMLIDDNGWEYEVVHTVRSATRDAPEQHTESHIPTRPRKPINEKATAIYRLNCVPGTTHQIVGDVVIVPDDDFGGPL